MINKKISQLIPLQLPQYIRDDPSYSNFIIFLQAYYEWMETQSNALYESKKLLDYNDIDLSTDKFLHYFLNDFLQYFPRDSLLNKSTAIKAAKQLYSSKGTLSSYKFLFRILYDIEAEVFLTSDAVLRPSDGVWYQPRYLRLATTDSRFLSISGYKLFGETSKAYAIVESTYASGNKINVYISNIERLFQSGENIIVVDSNNAKVVINGSTLTAKLVGQINQILVDSKNKGSLYSINDPVIVYGGINPSAISPVEATAKVKKATQGSMQSVTVVKGGVGYDLYPNTLISITNAQGSTAAVSSVKSMLPPAINIIDGGSGYRLYDVASVTVGLKEIIIGDVTSVSSTGSIEVITYRNELTMTPAEINDILGATVHITSSNPGIVFLADIALSSVPRYRNLTTSGIIFDSINPTVQEIHSGHQPGYLLGNTTNPVSWASFTKMPNANAQSRLMDVFKFDQFTSYTLGYVSLTNQGGSISPSAPPVVSATTYYPTDNPLFQGDISNLGILGPIEIINPGSNYSVGDEIRFVGGSGVGAYAVVSSIDGSGGITGIEYVSYPPFVHSDPIYGNTITYPPETVLYPTGGLGYTNDSLPEVMNGGEYQGLGVFGTGIDSVLKVSGILGTGAELAAVYEKLGEVISIEVTSPGEDYVSAPSVSLKVQDILVKGLNTANLPSKYDIIYQGDSFTSASYFATVDSIRLLTQSSNPSNSVYNLRIFEYNTPLLNSALPLNIIDNLTSLTYQINLVNIARPANFFYTGSPEYDSKGVKTYGDGTAKATATFLNGLSYGQGQYLTLNGQLSSSSVLQSIRYNDFTYELTVKKEIEKYRDILLNLVHPAGVQSIGRCSLEYRANTRSLSNNSYTYSNSPQEMAFSTYINVPDVSAKINTSFDLAGVTDVNSYTIKLYNTSVSSWLDRFTGYIYSDVYGWTIMSPNWFNILLTPKYGSPVYSEIYDLDYINNTITLKSSVQLLFSNVAYVSGVATSNSINVLQATNSYDIMNNGQYSNTSYPLLDVIFPGYEIKINDDVYTVNSISSTANTIELTTPLNNTVSNTLISVLRVIDVGGSLADKNEIKLSTDRDSYNILTRYL